MPEYSLWLCRAIPRCPPVCPDGFHSKQSAASLSACAEPPDEKVARCYQRRPLRAISESSGKLVRKVGFEPTRLAAPPPQDGASASSATSAREGCQRILATSGNLGKSKLKC